MSSSAQTARDKNDGSQSSQASGKKIAAPRDLRVVFAAILAVIPDDYPKKEAMQRAFQDKTFFWSPEMFFHGQGYYRLQEILEQHLPPIDDKMPLWMNMVLDEFNDEKTVVVTKPAKGD